MLTTKISYHNENNENTHNNDSANNANVRKHRSLIDLNSPFPSSIPRRSNSIDRNKLSKNIISSFGSPTSMKNEKRKVKERRHHSLSYISEPIASLKINDNFEKKLMDDTGSTTALFYQFEKENKQNDIEDIKGKETRSKYSTEAVNLLLMENEKKVKSLNDESANYLLSKYTNSLLKESLEKNSNEIKPTPTTLSLSPSTSQPSSIDLNFNKTKDNSQSSKKMYQFIAGDSKCPSSTTISNSISYNSNDSMKTKNSLTNHHSISHLKYPMSFRKKKSTPSSEFTQNTKEYDDFEDDDLSFSINSDDDDEIKTQQQNEMFKELDKDIKILELSPQPTKIKTVNKENGMNTIPIINSSHPSSIPILSNSKHSNEKSINNISSSSSFSVVHPNTTFLQNNNKSNTEALVEPSTKSSSSFIFNPSKEDVSNSSDKSTTFNNINSINKKENSIDDKTILNTFTVVFDNISSLTTKIDLLTEIMDKNEEKQQQQYNLDMNQINFELFEIKQKVGQSMKRLQQEIDPILQALKEKNKKEKNENKVKFDEKKTIQTSLLSEKEKAEIFLEQEAIKAKNEYLEQNLSIMKSKIKNFSKENQILKKHLDTISARLPYIFFFHIITFGLLLFLIIHGMSSDKKENIYELSLQGRNYIQFQFKNILKFFYRIWYQIISNLNNQYYY